jgi:trigger factor
MRTSVTELPDSRVRVEVAVDADAVEKRIERTARELGREMRVPGFRRGKVPAALVLQRVGRETVLEQALRDALPEWYERALVEAGITPVGDPSLDVGELPDAGEPLEFSIEVGVRPRAKLGDYRGLEVGRAEVEVPEDAVAAELDRLREGFAAVNPVDRAAAAGDLAVIDYEGTVDGAAFEGGSARDYMVELGADGLLPEMEEALTGASAGDELTVEVDFPSDHGQAALAGKRATFAITVKEVREKRLPELDDDFAADASEFDSLDELRGEISSRLAEGLERRVDSDFREAAVDAAAAAAEVELPDEIVHARAHEMWERLERQLQRRGVDPSAYLKMSGKTREEFIGEAEDEARKALRREATLEAIADAEGIEVSDDELREALGPGEGRDSPDKLLARLRESGRDSLLRDELRMRTAAELVADEAKPIALDQAAAREALWTPEKERAEQGEGGLWTPGSGVAGAPEGGR